jgi:mutator family transposase
MIAAAIRIVFAQPGPAHVGGQLGNIAAMLGRQFPKVEAMLRDAADNITTFADFPVSHWKKIWSTNPLERLNKEIKRRTDVVGVFPNPASLLRLAGAILVEAHDEWQVTERRYLSEGSMALLDSTPADPKEVATPALLTAWSAPLPLTSTVKITYTTQRDVTRRERADRHLLMTTAAAATVSMSRAGGGRRGNRLRLAGRADRETVRGRSLRTTRTSGRCPASCAVLGAASPGSGGPQT